MLHLDDSRLTKTFCRWKFTLRDRDNGNSILGVRYRRTTDRLYAATIVRCRINAHIPNYTKATKISSSEKSAQPAAHNLWNRRLVHVQDPVVSKTIKSGTYGMNSSCGEFQSCTVCDESEQTEKPATGEVFRKTQHVTVHADKCRPLHIATFTGRRYFLDLTAVLQRFSSVHMINIRLDIDKHCFNFV